MLTVTMLPERLKTQYHLMEVTFLVLLSFHDITDAAIECACILASHLCTKCFNENFQVTAVAIYNFIMLLFCNVNWLTIIKYGGT